MFNFTTTTLIHSLDQFVANPTNVSAGQTPGESMLNPSHNTLWVNGVNLFRKENVVAIYRSPYTLPLDGRLVVDVNEILDALAGSGLFGVHGANMPSSVRIRLKFSLRRTGDSNSYYARDEVFKGKDFVYEFVVTSTDSTNAVTKVAKQIKKINRLYGDIYLDVHVGTATDDNILKTYDGNTTTPGGGGDPVPAFGGSVNGYVEEMSEVGNLIFVNDNYGMFTDASLEVWMDEQSDCCTYKEGGWIPFDQIDCHDSICVTNCSATPCDNITRGVKQSTVGLLHIVDCVNGTGTYQQILRDLRLPTMENLAYGSLTQQMNEMPVPGMNYVQYTLHYVTCRGILGGSAVGEVTHSKTTHVFFVPATCCNCENVNTYDIDAAFQEALFAAFGWEVCNEDGKAPAPVGRIAPAPHEDPTVAPSFRDQLKEAALNETRTNNDTPPAAVEDENLTDNEPSSGGGDVPGIPGKPANIPTQSDGDENQPVIGG